MDGRLVKQRESDSVFEEKDVRYRGRCLSEVKRDAEAASALWFLLDVVQFLFGGDWLELRICRVSAVSSAEIRVFSSGTLVEVHAGNS